MGFIPMLALLHRAAAKKYAAPSFCVCSAETIKAGLTVAARLRSPVILMSGLMEFAPPVCRLAEEKWETSLFFIL